MEASISPNDLFSTHHHLMWLLVRNNFSGKISSKESLVLDTGKKKILEVAIWMLVHNLLACWISLKNVGVE